MLLPKAYPETPVGTLIHLTGLVLSVAQSMVSVAEKPLYDVLSSIENPVSQPPIDYLKSQSQY